MKIEEYIASGILEAYVLQELSAEEMREVEQMALEHTAVREEIAIIEQTFEEIAIKTSVTPSQGLKATILNQIEDKKSASKEVSMNVSNQAQQSGLFKYLTAASVVLAVISSTLAYNYYSKWKSTDQELTTLIAQNQKIAEDYNIVNQQMGRLQNDFKIANDPNFLRVKLAGTDNSPNSSAQVFWNASSESVYLSVQSMEELAEGKQYQLWAIIDGQPVDAGVFDHDISGLFEMKNIGEGATTFAVTIEPTGGSKSPSLETMQVAGNV